MVSVPKVRRGNYNRIDVLLLVEHFLVIHISIVLVAVPRQQPRNSSLIISNPDIANRLKANTGYVSAGIH